MAQRDETRPAATGRGPNGFSFDDEYTKDSADADREQLERLDLNGLGLDHRGVHIQNAGARAPSDAVLSVQNRRPISS
jgi:hypothetical protein